MRFAAPQILWLLLLLPPALVAFLWWAWRKKQTLLTQFIEPRLLAGLTAGVSPGRRQLRLALLVAAVAFLIFTLARLQWGFDWEETKQRGLDIVVAIDTSKSMLAEDIAPNRLARAKLAALDLMQQARADRLGLVTFAGVAFLQCPLTVDDAAFRQSVESLDVNTIPQGGTAIADAIETAQTAFQAQDNEKALVLFTDGEDHDSRALEAAEKAAQAGMRIFTIGIGTPEGELLRVPDTKGRTDYVRDEDGNVVKSHLNERLLRDLAAKSRGFYLPLRGADTMDKLYAAGLSKLTKTESAARLVKRYHERFYWPLLLAIVCLLTEMALPERKRPARPAGATGQTAAAEPEAPRAASSLAPPRPVPTAAAVLLLLTLPRLAGASPATALRDYRAGKYDQALKEYRQSLERRGEDPRLHFNAGAAAYRDGQFEEAMKQFGAALAAPDLKLQQDAYYNLGNAFYQLGERAAEPAKKRDAWEKALKDYESTLKLDPKDADAKFNEQFVKRLLEELKKQQQQQDRQNQNNPPKNDQDKSQQQSQKDAGKEQPQKQPDPARQDQQQKDPRQQPQQSPQNQQGKQQESQPSQAKNQKDQPKQEQPRSAQAQQSKDQQSKEGDQSEAAPAAAGQMTPQQARQLLDAAKAQEAMLPLDIQKKPLDSSRRFKDW